MSLCLKPCDLCDEPGYAANRCHLEKGHTGWHDCCGVEEP